jgi:hypothetical protein
MEKDMMRRTTINVDDRTFQQAGIKALQEGVTVATAGRVG